MTPRVLALVGPTAAGKSTIALEAAERLGAELVAVDAFTVYRGMDVATAKPDAAMRARVPHHGLDLLEPEEECSVEWFQRRARATIDEVASRGRLPLLVGGSGLYFRAVVDDLAFPPTDAAVRSRLLEAHRADPGAAHAELARLDPAAAARIDPENLRRTVRALEVLELTGRPFSSWRTAWETHEAVYPDLVVVGVDRDRDDLAARIAARVEAMRAGGLLDEARALAGRHLSRTARQAIGYAEAFAHLAGELTLEEALERIAARTRRFAARQQRWFAADPRVAWHDARDAAEALRRAGQEGRPA
ncbi:MAG: tRNA (adenosine(37)-N6)-dimethylallyltransferase MiaA [Actinomycetota bacterium]